VVEAAKSLLLILSALFPIVDPLGGSPIFLALTREYSPGARRALSLRIAMNSFFLLVGSYFIGTHILCNLRTIICECVMLFRMTDCEAAECAWPSLGFLCRSYKWAEDSSSFRPAGRC
jgi:hypothetical protein